MNYMALNDRYPKRSLEEKAIALTRQNDGQLIRDVLNETNDFSYGKVVISETLYKASVQGKEWIVCAYLPIDSLLVRKKGKLVAYHYALPQYRKSNLTNGPYLSNEDNTFGPGLYMISEEKDFAMADTLCTRDRYCVDYTGTYWECKFYADGNKDGELFIPEYEKDGHIKMTLIKKAKVKEEMKP